ncbi:hypothetical protein QAY99_07290 [Glaesserella parasuis]|uniref:hypothetical protein n=2 Tax=Glaesserella parasuis TaxID=738 RepID=UPI0024372EC1|nr:hypothetical protein [Glaesserella parasuis]MDG6448534.1 hypothetical protein [Glaesserella parasuis]
MNWASYKGMQLNNTTLNENTVGTSYPMTNNTLGGRLSFGLYDQGYTEKASGLFRDGKVEYAVAPRDIVGTGVQLPWVPGAFSVGIGNTNTTGSNTTGIPLWGILVGDHTKAYYKDERVINFLYPVVKDNGRARNEIINYQNKVWVKLDLKQKKLNLIINLLKVVNNEEHYIIIVLIIVWVLYGKRLSARFYVLD